MENSPMKKLVIFIIFLLISSTVYAIDVALIIECLMPQAEYIGSTTENTEAQYSDVIWQDIRPQPTWQDLINNETQCLQDISDAKTSEKRQVSKDEIDTEILIRAIVHAIVDEFNRNRTWDGKPSITRQQIIDAIKTEIDNLE
jgi:hypothetical protein